MLPFVHGEELNQLLGHIVKQLQLRMVKFP